MTPVLTSARHDHPVPPIRIVDGVATEKEIDGILDWARTHLDVCEDWLIRRDLFSVSFPDLTALRRRSATRSPAVARSEVQRLGADRQSGSRPHSTAKHPICHILENDLFEIARQAQASGLPVVHLVDSPGLPVPVMLATSADLFLPSYMSEFIGHSPTMFRRSQHFVTPPPVTSSWVFFQAISAEADHDERRRAVTVADHFGIRESE